MTPSAASIVGDLFAKNADTPHVDTLGPLAAPALAKLWPGDGHALAYGVASVVTGAAPVGLLAFGA